MMGVAQQRLKISQSQSICWNRAKHLSTLLRRTPMYPRSQVRDTSRIPQVRSDERRWHVLARSCLQRLFFTGFLPLVMWPQSSLFISSSRESRGASFSRSNIESPTYLQMAFEWKRFTQSGDVRGLRRVAQNW
ncbi:hypothetical protein BJY04DRAFT_98213 [Aspergillus karnatakaensis]|uniref:uncharacterized protein n=1 Tax=Aspergillus karnatakaensis TaxID=1810916 RepID=UPI003CCCE949